MRLFVAIEFPDEVKQGLQLLQRAEAERTLGYRWIKPSQLHLTMKFLGEVADANVESVWRALEAMPSIGAFTLGFDWYRTLPDTGRPRLLALELSGDMDRLASLHGELESSFECHGFPREGRPFFPHVTVARRDPRKMLGYAALYYEKPWQGLFVASQLSLVRSRLKSRGAQYETMARFSFA